MQNSVEAPSRDGIHRIHRVDKPRRNVISGREVRAFIPKEVTPPSYLKLDPGTIFIGQEPTTVASEEAIAKRLSEQPEPWRAKQVSHRISPKWLVYANQLPEEAEPTEPLQNSA